MISCTVLIHKGPILHVCVCRGIQSEDENELNTVNMRTFALWHYSNDTHSAYRGIEEYKPYPHFCFACACYAHSTVGAPWRTG